MSIGDKPAFPFNAPEQEDFAAGMTYREWLIGQALAGMVQAYGERKEETVAKWTIGMADAVLAAMEKEQ